MMSNVNEIQLTFWTKASLSEKNISIGQLELLESVVKTLVYLLIYLFKYRLVLYLYTNQLAILNLVFFNM